MEKIKYLKILPFENIKNARNLGGYPTIDGEITSWKSFIRRPMRQEEIQRLIEKKDTIGKSYITLIDNFPAIKKIFEIMANADGSVLFHCQEGKDRTGIISMILFGLVGVFRTDIMADYEISSANLGYVDMYGQNENEAVFRITSPYNIKEAIEYLQRNYGTYDAYLEYAGVEKKIIEKIKEKMIE